MVIIRVMVPFECLMFYNNDNIHVSLQTRCQDIMSHQTMLDSISDKGSALASTKVKGKLNDLNAKYNTLCGSAQVKLLFALLKEARSGKCHQFYLNFMKISHEKLFFG